MRRALLFLTLVGCTEKKACKPETALLTIDGAAGAYAVKVTVGDNLGRQAMQTLALTGHDSGTVEVDFAGYPEGHTFTWDVVAIDAGGAALAHEFGSTPLLPTCTTIAVHLHASAPLPDLSVPDLFVRRTCSKDIECANFNCVSGYCCDRQCIGQCESCAVPGQEGHCVVANASPAPAPGCFGTGACAAVCNGVDSDCVYPTGECVAARCTQGFGQPANTCNQGGCMGPPASACANNICGATACATVVEMAAGDRHACAVLSDGTVACWGENLSFQLGATTPANNLPVRVPGISNAAHVACGITHTCVARTDGTVSCWGDNSLRQHGDGTAPLTPSPTTVLVSAGTPLTDVVQLSAGLFYTCALTSGHAAWCWGHTNSIATGLIGGNPAAPSSFAQRVCARDSASQSCAGADDILEIAAGEDHACFRVTGNIVACWGENSLGGCAQPAPSPVPQPKTVSGLVARRLALNDGVSCALLDDGSFTIACWGRNNWGQLGQCGTDSGAHPSPSPVQGSACSGAAGGFQDVSVGRMHGCGVLGGAVSCWGTNDHGQLLTGDKVDRYFAANPSPVAGRVWAAGNFGCSLDVGIGPRCWGADESHQIGDGDNQDKVAPTAPNLKN